MSFPIHKAAPVVAVLSAAMLVPVVLIGSRPAPATGCLTGPPVAAGNFHSLAMRGGTVWAWGNNVFGQVGDGTTTDRQSPVPVAGLAGVTAVAAGVYHSLAVRGDGTVWAWGNNQDGQLGDGTRVERRTPVQVAGLTGVTAVAAGFNHSLAVRGDGTVWVWGDNYYGQLGDGTTTARYSPVQVAGMTGVTAVAAGHYHSLAVRGDGTVWVWGANFHGQLGDGTTTARYSPVQVAGLTGVTAVAAGYGHSLAVRGDGTVWAWGYNYDGQVGDGTTTDRYSPLQVAGLTGVVAVAAGYRHSLGVRGDGTVWAWGDNNSGQLGDGSFTNRHSPVHVARLTDVAAVAAGYDHSLAVRGETVWAWGRNGSGQVGDGTTTNRNSPVQVGAVMTTCAPTVSPSPLPTVSPSPLPTVSPSPLPWATELPGGVGSPSEDCATTVTDGFVGSTYLRLATSQPDPQTTWLCVRIDDGTSRAIGGRLVVTAPALANVDPPTSDTTAAACATAPGNTVPGPHPLLPGEIGDPADPTTHATYSIDAYATAGTAWLCVTVAGPSGSQQRRIVVTIPSPVAPATVFLPDAPGSRLPTRPVNSAPQSGACQAGAAGAKAEYVNTDTVGHRVWLGTWQESATRLHLCVRGDGAVMAGGQLVLDTGATTLTPVIQPGTNAAICGLNVASQGGAAPFSIRRSSQANPASICVTVNGITNTLTLGATGGATPPAATWQPDPGTPG